MLVIVETDARGHRPEYVAHLADYWSNTRGEAACLLGPAEVYAAVASRLPESGQELVHWETTSDRAGLCNRIEELRRSGHDVVVPDGNRWVNEFARRPLFRRTAGTLNLLILRPPLLRFVAPRQLPRAVAKWCILRALSLLPHVHVRALSGLEKRRIVTFDGVRDPLVSASCDIPEPTIRLTPDTVWFGFFGRVDRRKEPLLIAEALSDAASSGGSARFGLLIAGKQDDDVRRDFECFDPASGLEFRLVDRELPSDELQGLMQSVNVVVVARSNEGSSGIFIRSVGCGKPVLAAGSRSLERECDGCDGFVWSPLDRTSLSEAALQLAEFVQQGRHVRGAPVPATPEDFAAELLADVI